ncbi:MAG: glycosyltransferase [Treponema sp.]|nr:glycosyltransferase [Treponema sp.]MEE3435013.1 glycosyltransferase [Treponema sp.]
MVDNGVLFSVVVLTYNQKDFINETLKNIIKQKHKYKYEILVGDDCSIDGTQKIIEQYTIKYPYVIKPVYNKKNLGAMANFYATAARAKGKYLMFCSGDDYWLPGKVVKQIEFMERNLDFAFCYSKANVDGGQGFGSTKYTGSNLLDFKDLYYKGNKIPALTVCARMDFFKKYLQEVNPQEKNWLMEDYPFYLYAAFESKIYFINETLAVYRVVENSLSHQVDINKELRFEKSVYDIKKFFADKYSLKIGSWNEKRICKKIKRARKQSVLCEKIKRLLKCFVPYGFIVLKRRMDRCYD